MAVNEAEDCIVEGELDHHATFPAIAKHVLHDVVLASVSHEPAIILLDEDDEEDFSLAHKVNLDVLLSKIAVDQTNFLLFLATALLATESNDVIALVFWEKCLEVQVLRLAGMVPSHC